MKLILEKLKNNQTRQSTKNNYVQIWRQFYRFIIKLDEIPDGLGIQNILIYRTSGQQRMSISFNKIVCSCNQTHASDGWL